ncbi:MAG: serine/threonine protein kinase [Xanthomonadales bacterium]|nr:serine/threonine protein kinase [Xanthomonadales bacterium]
MTMDYARLRDLFETCVGMAAGERCAWLDRHIGDTAERIELELMLLADANESPLLRADPADLISTLEGDAEAFDPASLVGRRYGAFRLVEFIGSGGQGTVYRAERVDGDFAQVVAVKLLRRGLHEAQEHRRFRRERDILARLDHPGVARLIDGGVSDEGIPYLIMELVDGEPIDRWCDHHAATRGQRLALFERLCLIVADAHRALVVHRDLKPSNVMVNAAGEVKVLDFGIARLLDEDDAHARTVVPMLTPGYGAPEQASAGAITLATDVYALGVLLRQLLTGQVPRIAGQPGAVTIMPAGSLPAELGWVIAKACEVDPARRYRDAAAFAEEIARYRAAQPVQAHPPSRWYALRKFVHRHRVGMAAASAVLAAVLSGAGLAVWQSGVAREQARRAEATRDFLLGVFESAQEDLPEDTRPTPEQLVQAAASRVDADQRLPAETRADFLGSLGHVARYGNDPAAALPLFERALAAIADAPDTTQHLELEIARAWSLIETGRAAEAETSLRPRMPAVRRADDALAAEGLWAYADSLGELGRLDDNLRLLEEARPRMQRAHAPGDLAEMSFDGAYSLALSALGRQRESAQVQEAMLARWRESGQPQRRDYAISLANLGLLERRLGELDKAEDLLREAVALNRRIHEGAHPDTATTMQLLGVLLSERGASDEAEVLLRASHEALVKLHGNEHKSTIAALRSQGLLDLERQQYAPAAQTLQRVVDTCASMAQGAGISACITALHMLARARLHLGDVDDAIAIARRGLEQQRAVAGDASSDNAIPQRVLGDALLAKGQAAQALREFDAATRLYQAAGIGENLEVAALAESRARAELALGDARAALADMQRGMAMLERLAPGNAGRRLRMLATHANALHALARDDEARNAAHAALALADARAVLAPGEWEALTALASKPGVDASTVRANR